MSDIAIGLIGYGGWARLAYTPVLQALPGVRVVAVSARSDKSRALACEAFGAEVVAHASYESLLLEPHIDAVMIALPNSLHSDVLAAALASKKHVFFEPPIALDESAAERLFTAVEHSPSVVQADLELRYLPVVEAVQRLLVEEGIGAARMAKIRLWCSWGYGGGEWIDEVQDQSFFLWLGCWYLDVLDCVFKTSPTRVQVSGGHGMNGKLLDHGWALLEYPPSGIGQFEFNLLAVDGVQIRLDVAGTKGEVEADLESGEYRWRRDGGAWTTEIAQASLPAHGFVGMRESISDFISAIADGRGVRADVNVCRRVHAAAFRCAAVE
ncbi:MAG: Gfo/Idh/MocA family oxidoreductase [Planctomycetes bacterium]|nr:Gfo/Idh/MocA family oxidoreductase [Planctomycetota bacterium]